MGSCWASSGSSGTYSMNSPTSDDRLCLGFGLGTGTLVHSFPSSHAIAARGLGGTFLRQLVH